VGVLLSLLPALLAVGAQSPGGGSPARRLTEQDLRVAFERAQQALAAKDYPAPQSRADIARCHLIGFRPRLLYPKLYPQP
jgi:hypothetical protein